MATKNSTIIEKLWLEGTNDFQQRIPDPTQTSMDQVSKNLFDPMNKMVYNQFMDGLVNRIGMTYVLQKAWENPLAVFKKGKMNYGATIQEIAIKWVKAHSYEDDAETLLKMSRPEAAACYHSVNAERQYPITINRPEVRRAFVDEYGLNNLVAGIMQAPINSDNYDEYRSMMQLIAYYDGNWGFYKHQASAPTDEATAKAFLKDVRAYAGRLKFPSTLYNAGIVEDIPVFVKNPAEELVLMIQPDALASIDVDALAAAFNMSKADIQMRIVIVDEFPIPGAFALLTTSDFFVAQDTEYSNGSFYNPQTLSTNYFLNHWQILSVSPFVPAILFTTESGTEIGSVELSTSGITASASPAAIEEFGGTSQIVTTLSGTVTPDGTDIELEPTACTFEISEISGTKNSRTYVDKYGVLHTQKTGWAEDTGNSVTVTCTSTYVNPSGATTKYTADVEIAVGPQA